MALEWDEAKRASNILKHGADFVELASFSWGTAYVAADIEHSGVEVRLKAIGLLHAQMFAIIFTIRRGQCRIISMRRASQREVREYGDQSSDAVR